MTKVEMAQVIHQALHNLKQLPAAEDCAVQRRARKNSVKTLEKQYQMALTAMASVKAKAA